MLVFPLKTNLGHPHFVLWHLRCKDSTGSSKNQDRRKVWWVRGPYGSIHIGYHIGQDWCSLANRYSEEKVQSLLTVDISFPWVILHFAPRPFPMILILAFFIIHSKIEVKCSSILCLVSDMSWCHTPQLHAHIIDSLEPLMTDVSLTIIGLVFSRRFTVYRPGCPSHFHICSAFRISDCWLILPRFFAIHHAVLSLNC